MKYLNYRYLFPPRPSNAIPNSELNYHDNGSMVAQVKTDGSNCIIFTNGKSIHVMNRHGSRLTRFQIKDEEILSLYKGSGGWSVLNFEYLNKNKINHYRFWFS